MESSIVISTSSPNSSEVAGGIAISCRRVEKRFYYYEQRTTTLRELFIRTVMRQPIAVRAPLFSLTGFDLTVHEGETVALIGGNGSGKSTVLRLIAGIYKPTGGVVETSGRVAAVLELGAGFHQELTGTDNIEFFGSLIGLKRREVQSRTPEIVEFAGLHDFMDVPMKYYSSGMKARLAFSMSVCLDPDTLLIDEALAVGDEEFRERCIERLHQLRGERRTLLLVSHDLDLVAELCSRGVWLDKGVVRTQGPVREVIDAYKADVA